MIHLERGNENELEGRVMIYTPYKGDTGLDKSSFFYCYSTKEMEDLVEIFKLDPQEIRKMAKKRSDLSFFNYVSFSEDIDLIRSQKGDLIRTCDASSRGVAVDYVKASCAIYWTKYFENIENKIEDLITIGEIIDDSRILSSTYLELAKKDFFEKSSLSRYVFNQFVAPIYSKDIEKLPGDYFRRMRAFFKGTSFMDEVGEIERLIENCDGSNLHLVEKHLELIEALSKKDYQRATSLRQDICRIKRENH